MHQSAVNWAVAQLSRAFPASFPDAGTVAQRTTLYTDLLEEHEWVTPDAWKSAIKWLVWHHEGEYVPAPAVIVETCRTEHRATERQAHNETVLALPVPDVQQPLQPPPGYSRARWDRNVAIGKARQRNRIALQERITPTETQVDEVLREMATRGQLKGALDEALAIRVAIDPYAPTPAAVRAPSVAEEVASGPIWPGARG